MGNFIPCSICGQPANVHLTQISSNEVSKAHFCEACAAKNGAMGGPLSPIMHALAVLQKNMASDAHPKASGASSAGKTCDNCGQTSEEFEKSHRLGCAACYKVFEEELAELLPHIQPGTEHGGKLPVGRALNNAIGESIAKARESMAAAIKSEAYEEAARLRDEIRRLEAAKNNSSAAP
jgi:protein arginine kinase activator